MSNTEHEALDQNKEFTIIVNGREKVVTVKEISFLQIVQIAFPGASINENTGYTVTYKKGDKNKPEGSMVDGDLVEVKSGMIFNVTATNRS